MTPTPRIVLPALSEVQKAHDAIDKIWADAEAENRPASVEEANQALMLLAASLGLDSEPDGEQGEPLVSLALAVARTLMDALTQAPTTDDPFAEYERVLRAAETEAIRNPSGAQALAAIADRWITEPFVTKRASRPRLRGDVKPVTNFPPR